MNKNILLTGLLVVTSFIIAFPNFINAQTFDIPEPQCVSVEGIPCPDDKNIDLSKIQKPLSLSVPETGDSKTFDNFLKTLSDRLRPLSKDINKFSGQIIGLLEIFFDKFIDFFKERSM